MPGLGQAVRIGAFLVPSMSKAPDPTPPPVWAIQQARTALQGGMGALEVEQRLVAVGLPPQAARDVMARALSKPSGPPPVVDWAMEHVRAALRAGVSVPEIERRLVAKGLTPEVAELVVTNVLGERVRGGQPDKSGQFGWRTLHWILSGVVGCLCILLGYWFGGGSSAGIAFVWILAPLAFIWFADEPFYFARISRRSPASPVFIRWAGWFLLVLYCLYRLELIAYKP
jgi:hypothetical protein